MCYAYGVWYFKGADRKVMVLAFPPNFLMTVDMVGAPHAQRTSALLKIINSLKSLKCCWMKQMTFHVPLPMMWLLQCFTCRVLLKYLKARF